MKKLNPTNYCARAIFLILSLLTSHAYGSVTILGSRIIYPEKSGSVDVLLKTMTIYLMSFRPGLMMEILILNRKNKIMRFLFHHLLYFVFSHAQVKSSE